MKKFKSLVLSLSMLCAVGIMTACGKVPEPTTDDVVEALVDEDIITKEQKKEGKFEVKINEVEINDDQDRATVECDFTIQDGPLSKTTEYEIKFKIRDDKETWRVRKGKVEAGEVKTELTEEIPDDKVKELLTWGGFNAEGEYISLGDSTTSYKIKSHKLDKKAMTDVVTIEGTATEGFLDVEFTVEYSFAYSSNWYQTGEVKVTESKSEFVEGYEMTELADGDFEQMLADKGKTFRVMGYRYSAESEDVSVSDVKLGEIEYNGSYSTAEVTFTIKEKDVELTIESKVVFYFDIDNKEWSISYFDEEKLTSFKCGAIGTWNGTNEEDKVVITINDTLLEDKSCLSASVTVTNAEGVTGTYDAYIYEYNPSDYYMAIEDGDWTVEAADSSLQKLSFYGNMDEKLSTFKGRYDWDKWSFTKQ